MLKIAQLTRGFSLLREIKNNNNNNTYSWGIINFFYLEWDIECLIQVVILEMFEKILRNGCILVFLFLLTGEHVKWFADNNLVEN